MKKYIILLLLISFSLNAQIKENKLVLTRTIAQLANQENQLLISISENGKVNIKYPKYHSYYAQKNNFLNNFSKKTAKTIVFRLLNFNWATENIASQVKSIRSKNNTHLFYNSEPDLVELSYIENNKVIWYIFIEDFLKIENINKNTGDFGDIVALINTMQQLSNDYIQQKNNENAQ